MIKGRVAGAGAWSSGGNCNNKNQATGCFGVQNACMYGGGKTGSPTVTTSVDTSETYDGTSWTEVGDLATAATAVSGSPAGTSLLALKTGGTPQTSSQASTEEWTEPVYTIKTVTVS